MSKERLTREPEITAAIISVIGTIVGTLLISVLLGFLEGRVGLGAVVGVVTFLLLIAIWVLLVVRWGVRLAGVAAAVMVIVGSVIFLIAATARVIPFSVPGATPVAVVPSPTPQQMAALTATSLPPAPTTPPSTPAPPPGGQCRIAYEQDGDIYVKNCDGSGVYRVTDHPAIDRNPAWSPDGQRIVFSSERDRQPTPGYMPGFLYIVNADGSNLTRLTYEEAEGTNDIWPDWSPDGSRIAFHRNGSLAIANPDGSNLSVILQESDELSVINPVWSPDGQRLAFISGRGDVEVTVCLVNADGTGLLELKDFEAKYVSAVWSPDGSQVGLEVSYDAGTKYYLMKADGSGEPVEVASISDSWHPWYWPKWGGKPAPSPASAEQVRAFAEPILAAIAGREPTWGDDFSNPGSGWPNDVKDEGKRGYEDGEYVIIANPHPSWPEECCWCNGSGPSGVPEFSDFVLEADLRFISGAVSGDPGHWTVIFRSSYQAKFRPGSLQVHKIAEEGEDTVLAEHHGAPIKPVEETNHLQIIAKGPQIAFYLNGEPVGLVYDETFSKGTIVLLVCTHTDSPLRAHFDNMKVWDISGLSL